VAIDLGPNGTRALGAVEVGVLLELRPPWMLDAACREYPEVSFYAELGESLDPARAVCAGCLVRDECLDHALEKGEKFGVWGGKSPRERQAMRRLRRAS
jgi:WhiB family redox-sensing transcriptional regulator